MAIMEATPQIVVGPQGKAPTVTVYTDAGSGVLQAQTLQIPKNSDEMASLIAQRSALTDQLEQLKDQRNDLTYQLREGPAEANIGVGAQLKDLNGQIAAVQSQINLIGREMAGASADLIAMTHEPSDSGDEPGSFADGAFAGAAGGVVGVTILFLLGRWIWKRFIRGDTASPRMLPADDSERLKRLENGIDAMAIEIERISEGQRFVTRLMSESRGLESTPR
jgi:hypothetical protein